MTEHVGVTEEPDPLTAGIRRLAQAMADLGPTVDRVAKNPHFRSGYCPLPDLMLVVRPVLEKHNLILTQPLFDTGRSGTVGVETQILCGRTGARLVASRFAIPCDDTNPQKATAAVTYARRTGITSLLGIAEDDDDGNKASEKDDSRPSAGSTGGKGFFG